MASWQKTDGPGDHAATSVHAARPTPRQPATAAAISPDPTTTAVDHEHCLADIIAGDIVPALLRQHAPSPRPASDALDQHVAMLADALVAPTADDLEAQIRAWRDSGVGLEQIYLEIMAPAARRLGERWSTDDLEFTAVTLGLWRLQRTLAELSPSFVAGARHDRGTCLLTPAPRSQHTFGLFMVGEFFRRAGWQVADLPGASRADLLAAVGTTPFDLVGFSLGARNQLDDLGAAVRAIRDASCNARLRILVGGPAVVDDDVDAAALGADAIAHSVSEALIVADLLTAQTAAGPMRPGARPWD